MASLGNVGKNIPRSFFRSPFNAFMADKEPTSVVMSGTSDVPYSFASLIRNAIVVARTRSDAAGAWGFYDMDDSGTQLYTIATYTQDGPTGELWSATVVGSVATVTKLFGSQRAQAAAFA